MSSLESRLARLEDRIDTLETVSDSKSSKKDKKAKGSKKEKKDKGSKDSKKKRASVYYLVNTPGSGDSSFHNSAVFRESMQRRMNDNFDIDCKLHDARHREEEEDPVGSVVFTGTRPLGLHSREEALSNLPANAHNLPLVFLSSGGEHYEGEMPGVKVLRVPGNLVHDSSSMTEAIDSTIEALMKK